MRAVIQRVSNASVSIGGLQKSAIGHGLLILLAVEDSDTDEDLAWLVKKISNLRIFDDANGVMNCSILDVQGEALIRKETALHGSALAVMKLAYRCTIPSASSWAKP